MTRFKIAHEGEWIKEVKINKKQQKELLTAWNEISEVYSDMEFIPKEELSESIIKCMKERLSIALNIIGDMVDEKVFQE